MRHAALHYHIDNQYSTSEFAINTWVCLLPFVNKCENADRVVLLYGEEDMKTEK